MRLPGTFALAFAVAFGLCAVGSARGYHTQFVSSNCNTAAPTPTSYITRDGSATVALRARYEGYQWGGGCWNDNDRDDSPGDPTETPGTGGEGGDCSGFTFKVWRESENESNGGFFQWGMFRFVHGPYTADRFRQGAGAPNIVVAKASLIRMDALASPNHIGLIWAKNADGSDQIIEAKGEAYGTGIWTRTYRGDSSYGGVRRTGWSS
jgi:hypothetical protein